MATKALSVVSALCFLSFIGVAYCHNADRFFVEGKVYCDTCRIQFITKASKFMEGARVKVECREREGGSLTFSNEAVTDKFGAYSVEVEGDHEEEVCEVSLVKSSDDECSELSTKGYGHKARISATGNNGISSPVRQANALGFVKKTPLPQCPQILHELGLTPDGMLL